MWYAIALYVVLSLLMTVAIVVGNPRYKRGVRVPVKDYVLSFLAGLIWPVIVAVFLGYLLFTVRERRNR